MIMTPTRMKTDVPNAGTPVQGQHISRADVGSCDHARAVLGHAASVGGQAVKAFHFSLEEEANGSPLVHSRRMGVRLT